MPLDPHPARQGTPRQLRLALALLAYTALGVHRAAAEPPTVRSLEVQPGPDAQLRPDEFFALYARRLRLGPDDALELQARRPSLTPPLTAAFYRQTHRGVPVDGGTFSLTLRDGFVRAGVGRVVPGVSADTDPRLSAGDAVIEAMRALARELRVDPANLDLAVAAETELMLVSLDGSLAPGSYRLAYRCVLVPKTPVASTAVDVDAASGSVLALHALREEDWQAAPATGDSAYEGTVGLGAQTDAATGQFRLRSAGVETYDNRWSPDPGDLTEAQDLVSDTSVFALADQAPGVSVHWAMPQASAYFQNTFGSSCQGGALGPIPTLTSYLIDLDNAFFDPGLKVFAFGSTPANFPLVAIDTVAHELAHCVRHQAVPVPLGVLSGEAAAIHESFSDIFGEMVERDQLQAAPDWKIGGHYVDYYRNLIEPNLSFVPGPDTYLGPLWQPGYNDSHRHCGVQNRWFTLLALGGAGTNGLGQPYDVKSIGPDTAARIAFQGLTEHVTPDFAAACAATTQSAIDICGDFSQEVVSTRAAWDAVGVLPTPMPSPFTQPADQATDVEPWPVQLRWQAVGTQSEGSWDVEVSDSADFTTNVHNFVTNDVTVGANSLLLGKVDAFLAAGQKHFWRVRRHPTANVLDCYRPVRSFTTKMKTVEPISPITPKGTFIKFHPWNLMFSWQPMAGVTRYAVQVSKDTSFDPASLLFPERVVDNATQVELDVHVDKTLYWRVRPIFQTADGEDVPGTWRKATFDTSVPKVNLVTPLQGEDVFPWPVNLGWDPVIGAEQFKLELQLGEDGNWGDPDAEPQAISLPGSQNTYSGFNVRADGYHLVYQWRVHVIGPSVPDGQGFPEEGTPASRLFQVTKAQTEVKNLKPSNESCPPVGQPFTFSWDGVVNSTSYVIKAAEVECVYDEQTYTAICHPGPEFQLPPIPATPTGVQQTELVDLNHPLTSKGLGYYWRVQAFGPDGKPGYVFGYFLPPSLSAKFFLQPDHPTIDAPAAEVPYGGNVTLTWSSKFAPFGRFWAYAYRGPDSACVDPPDWSYPVTGSWSGTSSVALTDGLSDPIGTRHSARVYPFVFNFTGSNACHAEYSGCRTFRVVEDTDPPAAPAVVPAPYFLGGGAGLLMVLFTAPADADTYSLEVFLGDTSGPTGPNLFIHPPFTAAQLAQATSEFIASLPPGSGSLPPGWYVGTIGGTQSFNHYYYHVKACNDAGCSPWSAWSQWIEGAPWPF